MLLGGRQMQVPVIETARKMGLRVVVVDPWHDAPGAELADEFHECDLADIPRLLDVASRCRPAGVMTFAADYPVVPLSRLCESLDLPGLSVAAALRSTNKIEMHRAFKAAGIPAPLSLSAVTIEEALVALRRVGEASEFAIFKPAVGHGGRGVTRVGTSDRRAVAERAFTHAMACTRGDGVLVEEFVSGPEFSLEGVRFNGQTHMVAVTDKLTTGAPHFVEIGHGQPSLFAAEAVRSLIDTAAAGVAALGLDACGIHAEIRLSPDGPRVMEIAGRFGGGFIASHLVPLSTGVDLCRAAIQMARGEVPDIAPTCRRGAAVRFLTPPPGMVTSVGGVERARDMPGVREARVLVGPGDGVAPLVDDTCRVGYVICEGDDQEMAMRRAGEALAQITIEVEGVPGDGVGGA